jgi:hypothetical protein
MRPVHAPAQAHAEPATATVERHRTDRPKRPFALRVTTACVMMALSATSRQRRVRHRGPCRGAGLPLPPQRSRSDESTSRSRRRRTGRPRLRVWSIRPARRHLHRSQSLQRVQELQRVQTLREGGRHLQCLPEGGVAGEVARRGRIRRASCSGLNRHVTFGLSCAGRPDAVRSAATLSAAYTEPTLAPGLRATEACGS